MVTRIKKKNKLKTIQNLIRLEPEKKFRFNLSFCQSKRGKTMRKQNHNEFSYLSSLGFSIVTTLLKDIAHI